MSKNRGTDKTEAAGAAGTEEHTGLIDELQQGISVEAQPMLKFIVDNAKRIIIGAGVAVAVVAAYGIYEYSAKSALQSARSELGAILVNKDGADRIAALETFAAKAPESVRGSALLEMVRLTTEAGEYAKAAEMWEKLSTTLPGNMSFIARLGRVQALLEQGKAEDAFAVMEAADTVAPESFKEYSKLQYALCAEEAGALEKALTAYESILANAETGEKNVLTYKVAVLKDRIAAK